MRIAQLIIALALLACLFPLPFGYEDLIRYAAAVLFAIMGYHFFEQEKKTWGFLGLLLAVVYQPWYKIPFPDLVLKILYPLTAAGLIFLYVKERRSDCQK